MYRNASIVHGIKFSAASTIATESMLYALHIAVERASTGCVEECVVYLYDVNGEQLMDSH